MKKIIVINLIIFLLAACTPAREAKQDTDEGLSSPEPVQTSTPAPTAASTPKPSPKPSPSATPKPKPMPTASPKTTSTPVPTSAPTPEPKWKEESYSVPQENYTEVWTEPEYYEEPIQEYQTYTDTSGASSYNGQYAGVSCEGVAGLYLGGDMSYVLASYGYQVWDPQPNDVIAYFDGGWNYRHTAVFLGNGQALHGS